MEKSGRIRGPALGGLHLWMALLLTLLLFPLLVTPQRAQQLRMVVLETSVATQQNKSDPETREPYFLEGHSLQMRCYYKTTTEDYCAEKNTTNLWVHPGNQSSIPESHIKVISKTKCNITVEIENASRTDQGSLVCEDRDHPESSTKRVLKIGDAPVPPSNLSLVFEPRRWMTLRLDPIKTAANLNDMDTKWNVMYIWDEVNSPKPCRRKESDANCQQLTAEGLCQPCVVRLKYSGCGQYGSDGSSGLPISFNVTVTNMFGASSARVQFLPADWVKPGSISSVEVCPGSNSTTLVLKVKSPPLFQGLYQAMGKSGYPLQLAYTVRLLSARDQSLTLPQARKFYDMYGFVRNLPDDQEALQHSGQLSHFPLSSGFVNWTSHRRPCSNTLQNQTVPIQALPFSSYHYNVSMVTRGRYIGDTFLVNISQAKTSETSPLEGPGLHASFAYCVHHASDVCATCILYFKEIPQISRGGVVLNHSLELTLVTPLSVPASNACMGEEGWGGETGGHNNTIVVRGVMMGAVYNVSLQAHTAVGPSPTTTAILNVSSQPLDFAPTNIVMEMSGQSYDMSWTPGEAASEASVTYFAHYCYTVPLQLQDEGGRGDNSSIAASLPLNCVTNMVSRRVDENSRSLFIFDDLNNYPGLTPAFFLSATSSQVGSTNLMPVEAFFARGTTCSSSTT